MLSTQLPDRNLLENGPEDEDSSTILASKPEDMLDEPHPKPRDPASVNDYNESNRNDSTLGLQLPSSLDLLAHAATESFTRKRKMSESDTVDKEKDGSVDDSKRCRADQVSELHSQDPTLLFNLLTQERSNNASLIKDLELLHTSHAAKNLHITQLEAVNEELVNLLVERDRRIEDLVRALVGGAGSSSAAAPRSEPHITTSITLKPSKTIIANVPTTPTDSLPPTPDTTIISPQQPPALSTANWGGIPVYQLHLASTTIMRRKTDSWINVTHVLKAANIPRGSRLRILEKEMHTGEHEKIQGGYGKYQGTWVPLHRAYKLAERYGLLQTLSPIFNVECFIRE
ncbi:uncharacterized protein SPPG_02885 [Spizellomyces punctatus DAOM BR117]|uniref:HTH APSES-type domain-containing protein n=1 Tax=Spizellomyces punctatus (strain DAOM BR117) TaxID=645134 RepID=A0A0L0HNM3_SPIPD|nr:uncharacterized protein SPPG_02885 [Spizellomyces punctatus DAOM BR117]KND02419.1 hypothetical protein SPPG_02885 [Spizellomyces punctatus DAOM BR117]|eukprot:XP_016610458.1 hypothetical protein SPPG_02885 [Spizellomyces punctatus DAOM BR117]